MNGILHFTAFSKRCRDITYPVRVRIQAIDAASVCPSYKEGKCCYALNLVIQGHPNEYYIELEELGCIQKAIPDLFDDE